MRHVITLVAQNLTLPQALVTQLGGQWCWIEEGHAGDVFVDARPDASALVMLEAFSTKYSADFILQPEKGREKKLLISDMDSTMIGQECIDEMADCLGLKSSIAAITERAMNGELDFQQALVERVALLKDLPEEALADVFAKKITFSPGARTLIATMRARGCYCLLVSGGFTFFTARVAAALGFDGQEANQLEMANGKLTGLVQMPILDKQAKLEALQRHCRQFGIGEESVLAIGDGANDLPMLKAAGLGVAYYAKPNVQREIISRINHTDLTTLLYAQGIGRQEWL